MAKKAKPYNGGQWTAARFRTFVKGALRSASKRWGPKNSVLKKARVARGLYKCVGFNRDAHNVRLSLKLHGVSRRNVFVDHIIPVMDPGHGFTSWDDVVRRMFVEEDGLQVLCKECHDLKTAEERKKRNVSV